MAPPKKKRKFDKRKPKRRQPPTFREPDSDYLREVLGHIDVALWVDQTPLYGKSEAVTIGDKRVCFQPELGANDQEAKRQENSSRRFKRFWATLTLAQKEALRIVYVNNPSGLTKVQVAEMLGIRVDTLQERIDNAVKKLRKFFPEYGN